MADEGEPYSSNLSSSVSDTHGQLLDVIDDLRSQGVSHYIPLPQLIVVGDQSSGKSSVLEAISGVRFPAKDNLCTRFATELVLRRGPKDTLSVSITPDPDRTDAEKSKLAAFDMPNARLDDLEELTEQAKLAMGLEVSNTTFTKDVLKVEVTGINQPNLTLVDLPGLIHAETEKQSKSDIDLVSSLVRTYMESPRSIILAVVSAKSDYANQAITSRAREVDPSRLRTLGIITKPDTLDVGSEMEKDYGDLVRLENARGFRLGWHVLKNRDFNSRTSSNAERDRAETDFFRQGFWMTLPARRLGIDALRPRLSNVLKDQIVSHLPNLTREVETGIVECRSVIERLGAERLTISDQRLYLLQLAQRFAHLMKEAVGGSYNDDFFGNATSQPGYEKRLRAVVQNTLLGFAKTMGQASGRKQLTESDAVISKPIKKDWFEREVSDLMKRSRGRELPGTFNPLIIGELFFTQSAHWAVSLEQCCSSVVLAARRCIDLALRHITNDKTRAGILKHIINPELQGVETTLKNKISEIVRPHQKGHPITYNHYFTDTIQKAQQEHQRAELKKAIFSLYGKPFGDSHFVLTGVSSETLLNALTRHTEQDMDRYACSEVIFCMDSYLKLLPLREHALTLLKVAMKVLVDNLASLAIEACLLERLSDLLNPKLVMVMDDVTLKAVAGEAREARLERMEAKVKLDSLERGAEILRRFDQQYFSVLQDHEEEHVITVNLSDDELSPDKDDSEVLPDDRPVDTYIQTSIPNGFPGTDKAISDLLSQPLGPLSASIDQSVPKAIPIKKKKANQSASVPKVASV